MGVSFLTKDSFFSGGGVFAAGTYRINLARWVDEGVYGKADSAQRKPGLFLRVDFQPMKPAKKKGEFEETGDIIRRYVSAGKLDHFTPNDDGTGLEKAGSIDQLPDNSNTGLFLLSLINAGLAVEDPENITSIQGLIGQFAAEPQPERKGFTMDGDAGDGSNKTYICCKSIEQDPDGEEYDGAEEEVPKGKGKGKPASKKGREKEEEPEEKEPEGGDLDEKFQELLTEHVCVKANKGGIEHAKARTKIFQAAQNDDDLDGDQAKQIIRMFNDKDGLKATLKELGWTLAGDTIKAGK